MTVSGRNAFFLLLIAATLVAYEPSWTGGMVWDDGGHITRPDLRSWEGLRRIWFEPGATQQYYPVLHSAFWILHQLWGDSTVGYHLVNIVLHGFSACLLFILLTRIGVPGAAFAAGIFALHPVHVESVAWITELKNVLSGLLYFTAALAYLDFDKSRARGTYLVALGGFLLAVFAKSVTATLPVALLIVIWWERGRVRLREDVKPLVPFLIAGAAAGLTTIWVERAFIGAEGAEFELSLAQRLMLAGRAVWFYLAKLLWPAGLVFIYPRWTIAPASLSQWLFPALLAATSGIAFALRRWSRAPLAVMLFFCATLFPALGFFNVYPFRFSYVADHFQYLASIGPIALFSAGATTGLERFGFRRSLTIVGCSVCVLLGALTFAESRQYASAETLYRTTIDRNPAAWLARNNLAALLLEGDPSPDRLSEASRQLEEAITLKPDYAEAHYNLGTALERLGRLDAAAERYNLVLQLAPGEQRSLSRLAAMRHDRASVLLEQGLADENAGRLDAAERAYREAAAIDPGRAIIRRSYGRALQRLGRAEEAVSEYRESLALEPQSAETHNDLGVMLAQLGRVDEAIRHFESAVRLDPGDPGARSNLARAQALIGRK